MMIRRQPNIKMAVRGGLSISLILAVLNAANSDSGAAVVAFVITFGFCAVIVLLVALTLRSLYPDSRNRHD